MVDSVGALTAYYAPHGADKSTEKSTKRIDIKCPIQFGRIL